MKCRARQPLKEYAQHSSLIIRGVDMVLQGFGSAFFCGSGSGSWGYPGGKGNKMKFLYTFFHVSDISELL